jgi:hypothetical protein
MISEFNGWPVYTPVNASPVVLPPPAHDSGTGWFAIPFLCGSFIRNSMPVYPGAFPDTSDSRRSDKPPEIGGTGKELS